MLVDQGAPQISLAEAEFAASAKFWQEQAAFAAAKAERFLELSLAMGRVYNETISRVLADDRSLSDMEAELTIDEQIKKLEAEIARHQTVIERLLEALKYKDANDRQCSPFDTQYELLRQYVRGDLEPRING